MAKPKFPGRFHDFVREHGYDRITLTVKDGEEVLYQGRHTVAQGTGVCAQALRAFHSERKSKGSVKCGVTFAEKVHIPSLTPKPTLNVEDCHVPSDDDWDWG